MKHILLALSLLLVTIAFAQEDSLKVKKFTETHEAWGMRLSAAHQDLFSTGVGLSYLRSYGSLNFPKSSCFYASIDWFPKYSSENRHNLMGFKVGYEQSFHLLLVGADLNLLSDFNRGEHLVFTPKIGVSIMGLINIAYGYNMMSARDKYLISENQISVP